MILTTIGHYSSEKLKEQEELIKKQINKKLNNIKPLAIYNGMGQEIDQIIAMVAKELKIPIVCCYAFPKESYTSIEKQIMENNQVIFVSSKQSKDAIQLRNEFMIDHSNKLLCIWDGTEDDEILSIRNYTLKQHKEIIDYEG